jgi:hypothetical protein
MNASRTAIVRPYREAADVAVQEFGRDALGGRAHRNANSATRAR